MAKWLLAGRGWTVARLDQAMQLWPEFRAFVWPLPSSPIDDRLDRLLKEIEAVKHEINTLKKNLERE